jgi:hypothetical protein
LPICFCDYERLSAIQKLSVLIQEALIIEKNINIDYIGIEHCNYKNDMIMSIWSRQRPYIATKAKCNVSYHSHTIFFLDEKFAAINPVFAIISFANLLDLDQTAKSIEGQKSLETNNDKIVDIVIVSVGFDNRFVPFYGWNFHLVGDFFGDCDNLIDCC